MLNEGSVAQSERPVTDLAPLDRPQGPAVIITTDQMDLIKATVAKDATDAELALFIYDNKRRGLHPLDRLLHFTKRGGKYTPVTSIDLFRSRAAATHEHVGTEDAQFVGVPEDEDFAATVTVYRLVQGVKCAFTATARMSEYMPDAPNDFMWKKMPHGQLGKCAEALALRKAFPQELDGLHTFDEMEQAPLDHPKQSELKAPQRKSEAKKAEPPAALTVDGVLVKCKKGGKFWSIEIKDDRRFFTAFDDAIGEQGEALKGKVVRITYVEKTATDKTYYNVSAIAAAPAASEPAKATVKVGEIFESAREPGSEG